MVATNQQRILHVALSSGDYVTQGRHALDQPRRWTQSQLQLRSARSSNAYWPRRGGRGASWMTRLKQGGSPHQPGRAGAALRGHFASGRASEAETSAYDRGPVCARVGDGASFCAPIPPSGVCIWLRISFGAHAVITLATAHPAKFPDAFSRPPPASAPRCRRRCQRVRPPRAMTPRGQRPEPVD